jgi:hypothetical protein
MVADPPRPPAPDGNIVAFRKRPEARPTPAPIAADPAAERARVRTNIVALVVAGVLVLLGWLLVDKISRSSRTQDCLMAGRSNCAPIRAP